MSELNIPQAAKTPISELADEARKHYDEASTAIHYWNSIIPQAIDLWEKHHLESERETQEYICTNCNTPFRSNNNFCPICGYMSVKLEETELSRAVRTLGRSLKTDEQLYYAWQSNIAMAFVDELKADELTTCVGRQTDYDIANAAAKKFLNSLISYNDE